MVKVKEGFFKKQETLSNDNVLLAHGGHKPLSEFKIGNYLPIAGGTMTGNINFAAGATPSTANGIYFSNGSHLSASGNTLYVFGASGVNIYPTPSSTSGLEISASTLKYKSNTVLDSGNSSVSGGGSIWGASITVKINNTEKTLQLPSDPNHVEVPGATNQLVHYKTTSLIGAVTATIGASNNPIWINGGVPTASGASIGSAALPIYLSSGKITPVTGSQMFSAFGSTGTTGTYITIAGYTRALQIPYATSAGKLSTNAGSTTQAIYFSNGIPTALTGTTGAANQPIYLNGGKFTPITYKLNATVLGNTTINRLVHYSSATEIGPVTATIGASNNPIWINSGVPTASGASIGTATNGVYLANGVITKMTYNLNATVNGGTQGKLAYYSSATAISSYASTVGNSIQPVYLNAGVPTAGATYFFIAYTALYGNKGATNINFNIPDSTRLSGTYYLNTAINGATTAFQNAPQTYGLVVDFNQFAGHLQFSSTNTANEIKARSYWWTNNTGFTYPSWVTLIHTGNYTDYLGYIATTPVKSGSTAGQNITGTGNITPNATDTYTLGSTTLLWKWTHTNRINLNRSSNAAFGRIYYYNSTYYTWVDYMSQSTVGYAPTGGQPSTTTEVTSWAKRSLIENTAGYGWIWEATTNAAAGATNTKPTARMSLSSNTGRLRIESAASTIDNNTGGLIISSALNASSGNIALELWRGTKASWMISNEAGDLHIRDNYTTAAQTTYLHDNVKISYNTGTITTHSIQPADTNTYNLGTSSLRWAKLYIGTADSYGSATKPIYWNAGVPAACTYDLKVNVLPGSTLSVAYYSEPDEISASSSVKILSGIGATSGATLYGISITGNGRGYANQLVSGVTGLFSYGDGGPQIRFIDDTQALSLIATRYDGGGGNMSLHLVSDQERVVFATEEIVAHNRLSVGVNVPNTTYGAYLNTSTAHNTGHIYLLGINSSSSTSNTTQIVFGPTTVASQHVALSSNSKAFIINPNVSSTTGQIYLGVNGNNSYFSSSGNVGIGNTAPAYKLHVAGNGYISTYLGVATAPRTDYKLATLSAYVYGATVSATYYGRTIAPNLNTGVIYLSAGEATTHYMVNRNSAGGGYYLHNNDIEYAHLFVSTVGTAASATAASKQGLALFAIGNSIPHGATGTTTGANNARGYLRIFATNQYYTDIASQGNGNHIVYLPNHASSMYLVHAANNNAVGSATKPVYIAANGRVTEGTHSLEATVNDGTANRIAYYSSATAISAASTLVSNGTYIRRAAVSSSWNNSDDNSMIYQNTINGLGAVLSLKTTGGHSWSIAHYDSANYHTDLLFGFLHADDHTGATSPTNRWRDCISLIPVTDAGTSRRAFVTANYTRSSATNGTAVEGNSTTPVYVNAKGIVVACQSYAGYGDGRYVKKTGDTMTGALYVPGLGMNMARDTSQEMGIIWYNTSSTKISSITYHNTAQNLILNAVGASNTYSDAVGKYSLFVGNNKLTYNTYPILTSNNWSSYVDGRYVKKTGDTMTGTLTMSAANILVSYTNANDANVRTTNSNGSIGILSSTNRGLYDHTKSAWVIATNGTNTWLSQGNVGIGNTAPGYKLDVSGTVRATGNISITAKSKGYFLTDKNSFTYPLGYDNGSNLWIGSTATQATHHTGQTYISAGHSGTAGNSTIYVCVPNADNNNGTNYAVYHAGYHPFLNSGTAGKLAYYSAALVISQYTTTVGTSAKPIYMNAGVPTALTATIGTSARPIYMSGGAMTACSASIGTSARAIYMSGGVMTALSASIGTSTKPIYMSGGVITASAASVGSSIRLMYLASGVMTAGATVSTLKGSFYDMKVLWCGICSRSYSSTSWSVTKKGGLCEASASYSSYQVTISLTSVSSASGVSGTINLCSTNVTLGTWTGKDGSTTSSAAGYNRGLMVINITSQTSSAATFKGYARSSDNTHWRNELALGHSTGSDDQGRITSFYVTMFGYLS